MSLLLPQRSELLSHGCVCRLKQEDEAWVEVGTSYNSFRAAVLEELEERKREFPSAKAKGKRKATAEDVAAWSIPERDLPTHFRGKDGLELARALVETDAWRGPLPRTSWLR